MKKTWLRTILHVWYREEQNEQCIFEYILSCLLNATIIFSRSLQHCVKIYMS